MTVRAIRVEGADGGPYEVRLRTDTKAEAERILHRFPPAPEARELSIVRRRVVEEIKAHPVLRVGKVGTRSLAVTIPKAIADRLGIHRGDLVQAAVGDGGQIVYSVVESIHHRPLPPENGAKKLSFDAPRRRP